VQPWECGHRGAWGQADAAMGVATRAGGGHRGRAGAGGRCRGHNLRGRAAQPGWRARDAKREGNRNPKS
jgi:hypothetical protein